MRKSNDKIHWKLFIIFPIAMDCIFKWKDVGIFQHFTFAVKINGQTTNEWINKWKTQLGCIFSPVLCSNKNIITSCRYSEIACCYVAVVRDKLLFANVDRFLLLMHKMNYLLSIYYRSLFFLLCKTFSCCKFFFVCLRDGKNYSSWIQWDRKSLCEFLSFLNPFDTNLSPPDILSYSH